MRRDVVSLSALSVFRCNVLKQGRSMASGIMLCHVPVNKTCNTAQLFVYLVGLITLAGLCNPGGYEL